MRSSMMNKIFFAGCIALALFVCNAAAQAQEPSDQEMALWFEMLQGGALPEESVGPLADDTEIGICLLTAAVDGFIELSACNNDPYCSTAAIFSLIIDALLCSNPEDENVVFLLCASDAVVEYFAKSAVCEEGDPCQVQNLLSLATAVIACSAGAGAPN